MDTIRKGLMTLGFNGPVVVPASVNEPQRFGFLVCGIFCAIASGIVYAFSLISGKFTDDYGFNQNEITTISTVGIVFGFFTIPFGFIFDYVGPKPIFLIGLSTAALGSLLFALIFVGTIGHSVAALSVSNAFLNIGSAMFDMGSILSVLSWFPVDRGLVVATAKMMTGLSSSVLATLYNTYFSGRHSEYMYFLLAFVLLIGLVAFFYMRLPPYHMTGYRLKHYTEEERGLAHRVEHMYLVKKASSRRFVVLFIALLGLLVTITAQSVAFVYVEGGEVPFRQRNPPAIVMLILFSVFSLAVVPWGWLDKPLWRRRSGDAQPVDASGETEGGKGERGDDERLVANDDANFPQYQTGFFFNIRHNLPLWCLWLNAVVVSGGVTIILLNSRQLYVAISGDTEGEQRPALYVAITSIGNALGRLCVSFFEVWNASLPLERRTAVTITYCVPSFLLFVACVLFLVVPADVLVLPMLFGGLATGSYAATLVLTVRTIFSIDVAKHYNSIFCFDFVGVIIFNRFLFGELLTRSSVTKGKTTVCLGRNKCLRTTFIVMMCCCVLAFAVCLLMHFVYMRYARSRREEMRRDVSAPERHDDAADAA